MPVLTRSRSTLAVYAARGDPRSDSELIVQFGSGRDESAFSTLVLRHGSLVYGVCRRALGPTADADDCFQATFLVLVQKAATIPWRSNLGPWLFGVAHRIAQKARFKRDRRFAVEKQVDTMPHPETTPANAIDSDELSRTFDEELAALPEEMRRAVVLCELQRRTRTQAAKELRISEGTLSSRLARARKTLRDRLAKRGFALAIPMAVTVSAKLTAATVGLLNGSAGVVPAAVWTLAQEALKTMAISKLKLGAVLVVLALGFTGFGLSASAEDDKKPQVKADPQVKPAAAVEKAKPGPVATINGQGIGREEFGDYLIRKYGAKEIEAFVSQKIIEAEAKKRGVKVTEADLKEAMAREIRYFEHQDREFQKTVLLQTGKSEEAWQRDILLPQVMLEKLCDEKVAVTDQELTNAFAVKFGGRRHVQFVHWPKTVELKAARDLYERAKREPLLFDQLAVRVQQYGFADAGESILAMYDDIRDGADRVVRDAAYALKSAGDVSDLIETEDGVIAVKLVEIVPPQKGKKFEDEKASLLANETYRKKMGQAGKRYFELNERAKPIYHIQPESLSQPQPTAPPAKK